MPEEAIITQEEYNKLAGNSYRPILLNDYEVNFIIRMLRKKFSERYDDKFLFLYKKLENFRNSDENEIIGKK
jgi:hypothetical protein